MIRLYLTKQIWIFVFVVCVLESPNLFSCVMQPLPRVRLAAQMPQAMVGFTPDGKYLLTADFDINASAISPPNSHCKLPFRKWHARTGEAAGEITPTIKDNSDAKSERTKTVYSYMLSPNGRTIAVLNRSDESLWIFDVETGKPLLQLKTGPEGPDIEHLAIYLECTFSPDGKYLLIESTPNTQLHKIPDSFACLPMFDVQHGRSGSYLSEVVNRKPPQKVSQIVTSRFSIFSKCGRHLLTSVPNGNDVDITVLELETRNKFRQTVPQKSVCLSKDGTKLLLQKMGITKEVLLGEGTMVAAIPVAGISETIAPGARSIFRLHPELQHISRYAPYPIEEERLNDGLIRSEYSRWDVSQSPARNISSFAYTYLAETSNSRYLAACKLTGSRGSEYATAIWFDFASNATKKLRDIRLDGCAGNLFLTEDGKTVAIYFSRFAPTDSDLSRKLREYCKTVSNWTGWNIDKQFFGIGRSRIEFWDGPSGKLVACIHDHHGLGFAPNGKTFATQDDDFNIYLWNVPPGRN